MSFSVKMFLMFFFHRKSKFFHLQSFLFLSMMLTHCRFQDSIRVRFPFFRLSKTPSRLIFTSSVIVHKEMQRTIPIIFSWSAPSCFISCLISFTYVPILDFLGLFLLPLDTKPFFGDAEKRAVRRKNKTKTWILVIFAQK